MTLNNECGQKNCGQIGYKAFDYILKNGSQYEVQSLKCTCPIWFRIPAFHKVKPVWFPEWEQFHVC